MARRIDRIGRLLVIIGAFSLAGVLALRFGTGGLWEGFRSALAISKPAQARSYDLTRLEAVNETLQYIRDRYVEPDRVKPRDMLMSALNFIQRDVAQVIILPAKKGAVTVRVDTHEKKLRVDNVLGPWDVSAKLREVFSFLQKHLKDSEVKLREIEYAACNGLLRTLDPHSVFLSPEAYKEMNLSTSGHFGGLGIVISIRDQLLTIIRPMPETPAGRAGLKRFDRVLKIDNESTLNMPLDDAVRRLRGKPGTKVTVWISREGKGGWAGTKKFVLTRERIRVRSVLSKRLSGGIAYVRLKQFQQTSAGEIRAALDQMRKESPLKGLILDLRGNPGGLLGQAAKVADLFLKRGTLVATVGASEGREEKRASAPGTEPNYPIVVLVNASSASASEIVAGALKNHDRALIVGQSTFGKGSVQLVFSDVTPDKAALKLTIAQYLTPGDRSIQGVGVTPHIELDPMTVDLLEMDLAVQHKQVRERDLSQHLSNNRATTPEKPLQVVRYFLSQSDRQQLRTRGGELADDFQLDLPTEFARDLILRVPNDPSAESHARAASSFIDDVRRSELKKVAAELASYQVDWESPPSAPPGAGPTKDDFEVSIKTDAPQNTITAGETINLLVTVTNNGTKPIYRLRATTESDNPYFNERELVFGKIDPGKSKTAKTPLSWCRFKGHRRGSARPAPENTARTCNIPKDALSRSDGVKVHFDASGSHTPASVEIRPTISALPRPLFQYSYQLSDNIKGNGDGLFQRGERLTIFLTVKNVGSGRSYETQANLANRSGNGVLLRKGRFDISNMMPGDVRQLAFTLDIQDQLAEPEVVLALSVGDRDLQEFATEKIRIPITSPVKISTSSRTAITTGNTKLFPDALASREAFGSLAKGTAIEQSGTHGDLAKVKLGANRFAFVKNDALENGAKATKEVSFEPIYNHAPPKLDIRSSAMATRKDTVKIDVQASDTERLLDMYMFVGPHKIYYQSNQNGADPKKASFSYNTPLQPGVNIITVVARETPDTTTRRTIVVRRDAADGSILKTPKHNSDNFHFLLEPKQ